MFAEVFIGIRLKSSWYSLLVLFFDTGLAFVASDFLVLEKPFSNLGMSLVLVDRK